MLYKLFTYKTLLIALLLVVGVQVHAQNMRSQFLVKLNNAYDLLYEDPDKAIEVGMKAYSLAEDNEDRWAMAIGHSGMAYISYEVGDYEIAYKNNIAALRMLEVADTTDLYNKTLVLNHLAIIHSDFNNHDESIRYAKQALSVAKKYLKRNKEHAIEKEATNILVEISFRMAIEYQAKGAHQSAGEILVGLWEDAEDKADMVAYAEILNELGIIKTKNGEFDDAQEYFGLVVSGQDVYEEDKAVAYHNLANTYMEQGNLSRAESYFLIGLDMVENLEDLRAQFATLQDLGELEYRRGESEKAIGYWEKALVTYGEIDRDPELYSVYNWLQLAYMDSDIQKAKEFNIKYSQMNDFYVRNQTEQRELEAQNRQALSDLIDGERDDRVNAAQRKAFFKQFWPIMLGVTLLLIFSIILGVRYYRTLRANKELTLAQLSTEKAQVQD